MIKVSPFIAVYSSPLFNLTPGMHFPIGPPSPGRARRLIDDRLHAVLSMLVMHAEAFGPDRLKVGDGVRFTYHAARCIEECLEIRPGPISDRLYREFRDWLRSEGGAFRAPEKRRYRAITVDAAGAIVVVPGEPVRYDII